jgi:hypothetical protein
MEPGSLQLVALWAGIVLAAATVISLVWAVWTYRRNAEAQVRNADAQVQLLALSTLQHYLDLAVAHPELASRDNDRPIDPQYGWFAAQALFTAQTLWTLVGHQAAWQRAINAIVRQHRPYLRSGAFVFADFAPEFVSYLRERVADLRGTELTDVE